MVEGEFVVRVVGVPYFYYTRKCVNLGLLFKWKRGCLGGEWFYHADIGGSAAEEANISAGLFVQP